MNNIGNILNRSDALQIRCRLFNFAAFVLMVHLLSMLSCECLARSPINSYHGTAGNFREKNKNYCKTAFVGEYRSTIIHQKLNLVGASRTIKKFDRLRNNNERSTMLIRPKLSLSTNSNNEEEEEEEVLLMIKLSLTEKTQSVYPVPTTVENARAFIRSFPFAAILPVQPLQYIPSKNGVSVTFLRKKTKEKGSVDGGVEINVHEIIDDELNDMTNADNRTILLTARRNSKGQTVGKIFSEKIMILALVDGIVDNQTDLGLAVKSIYHKWL